MIVTVKQVGVISRTGLTVFETTDSIDGMDSDLTIVTSLSTECIVIRLSRTGLKYASCRYMVIDDKFRDIDLSNMRIGPIDSRVKPVKIRIKFPTAFLMILSIKIIQIPAI